MTKNKLKLNVIVSIFSITLIVALLVFSASVFGWFSNNTVVNATGATVTVDVPKNIFVSSKDLSEEEDNVLDMNVISTTNYSFDVSCNFNYENRIYPVSYDGSDFYYARKVQPNGTARSEQNYPTFIEVDPIVGGFYYIEKTFYILTTYHEKANLDHLSIYLSNVSINQGTNQNSSIYKVVRVAISAEDMNGDIDEVIFRYDSNETCLPAHGENAVMDSDPALDSGNQASSGNNAFLMDLACADDEGVYFYPITVKIWIEGQNRNAVTAYAGTGFYVSFSFQIIE